MHVVSTDTECGEEKEGEGPDLMKVRENGATGGHAARSRPLMTLFAGHIGSEEDG